MRINEVFTSINGEVSPCKQGSIATFIRLADGCNLSCPWCDTPHHNVEIARIKNFVASDMHTTLLNLNKKKFARNVTITGGEPLLSYYNNSSNFVCLMQALNSGGYNVAIETNGTFRLPDRIRAFKNFKGFVVDYKFYLLDTGWSVDKAFAAGKDLTKDDYVKLVIDKSHHIGLAKHFLSYYMSFADPECWPTFAISIVNTGGNHYLNPSEVIDSFILDGFDVLLNVQIHKFLSVP